MDDFSYKPWIEHCKATEKVVKDLEAHGYCTDFDKYVEEWVCDEEIKKINLKYHE